MDPCKCYEIQSDKQIKEIDKALVPFSEIVSDIDELNRTVRRIVRELDVGEKIGCTVTGGMDSRSIYAHLKHLNVAPFITITGRDDNIDVRISRKLASLTGDRICIIRDEPENENWIGDTLKESDGMNGVCGFYRLVKKALYLEKQGVLFDFGGVGGEIYKNSFINQDFPDYHGQAKWDKFYKFKVAPYNYPMGICGQNIESHIQKVQEYVIENIRSSAQKKNHAYIEAGYHILQCRFAPISSMQSRHYVPYHPLMERNVAAYAYNSAPSKLGMQSYQRKQVTRFYPMIKNIKTDRGITCNDGSKYKESVASLLFLSKVYMARLVKREKNEVRRDITFEAGMAGREYRVALEKCRKMGILKGGKVAVPQIIGDRLFSIGAFFDRHVTDV